MGKYIKKCKGIGESTLMEMTRIGVRTRAQALAMAAEASSATAKRKKVSGGELKLPTSFAQLKRRRRLAVTQENSDLPATSLDSERRTLSDNRYSRPQSNHVLASCCSGNSSSDFTLKSIETVDLKNDGAEIETSRCNFDSGERRASVTIPSSDVQFESGELESTAEPSEANSGHLLSAEKMPSDIEVEEFFAAAEKDLQKGFSEKYNYDIVKDVPLDGRYEWVPLNP